MTGKVKTIPEGYHTLTPHITVRDARQAMTFYKKVFGAEDRGAAPGPDGDKVMHAEVKIGDSILMLNDEFPDWGCHSPLSKEGAGVCIHVYVDDVDTVFQRAIEAGATATMPVQDTFWGDRYGRFKDPFGHAWSVATHKEDLTPEQIQQRAAEAFAGSGGR